jgi:hypothetical protein
MDRDHHLSSFMTHYAANRVGVAAADPAGQPESAALIDLSTSKTYDAVNNLIFVTAERTAGAGSITVELWQNCPNSTLAGKWRKVDEATLDHLGEKRFDAVYAAQYKIRAATVAGGSTWTLHESHSAYTL